MRFARRSLVCLLLAAMVALPGSDANACGDFLPSSVLDGGDQALLTLPAMEFASEVARIAKPDIPEGAFPMVTDASTQAIERVELEAALRARGDTESDVAALMECVRAHRAELATLPERKWRADIAPMDDPIRDTPIAVPVPPRGLPLNFDLYLRGAAAWRVGAVPEAEEAWRSLLARADGRQPSLELRARYMLGRSLVERDPSEAVAHLSMVRTLVSGGTPDPLGLARASVGWEARAEYRSGHHVRALTLYHVLGDLDSLLMVLRVAFQSTEALDTLSTDTLCRRLTTAFVVSHGGPRGDTGIEPTDSRVGKWLEAVERVDAQSVEDADRLAWIAYATGDFDGARRFLARVGRRTPLAAWAEAKLSLRDGRLADAATELAAAAQGIPDDAIWESTRPTEADDTEGWFEPRRRLLAEAGAVAVRRGEFTAALTDFVEAGYWSDAAWIAERVLTTDELSIYVRDHCAATDEPTTSRPWGRERVPGGTLRFLLARRLARDGRWPEALRHYPESIRQDAESYSANLAAGRTRTRSRGERAQSLQAAARTLQAAGADLIGTELGPDCEISGGSFSRFDARPGRPPRDGVMTADEERRAAASAVIPGKRFHYRHIALDLAWEAATLMPRGDDEAAAWLCEAGQWADNLDTKTATRFYKALVRRCGKTYLGKAAAAQKWFPRAPK